MAISLYGGPLDGAITDGLSHLPVYMVATNHDDHPIYKRVCCCKTNSTHKTVPYVFVGYETQSYLWSDQELAEFQLKD